MNVIVRSVYNRPEFLYKSLEYEDVARKYYVNGDYLTIFAVEYGAPSIVYDIIKGYPYRYEILKKEKRESQSENVLRAFEFAFAKTSDYVIYTEDDVLLHYSYFRYVEEALKLSDKILSINGWSDAKLQCDDVNSMLKHHIYYSVNQIIKKDFFFNDIHPHLYQYYNSHASYIHKLYEENREILDRYGLDGVTWTEQDGLIRRIVAIKMSKCEGFCLLPFSARVMHIGFMGMNRPGILPGDSFQERLHCLNQIIANKSYINYTLINDYDDYYGFSPSLEEWDGSLRLVDTCDVEINQR